MAVDVTVVAGQLPVLVMGKTGKVRCIPGAARCKGHLEILHFGNIFLRCTYNLDRQRVRVNQRVRNLGQRSFGSFGSNVIAGTHRQKHASDRLLYLDH